MKALPTPQRETVLPLRRRKRERWPLVRQSGAEVLPTLPCVGPTARLVAGSFPEKSSERDAGRGGPGKAQPTRRATPPPRPPETPKQRHRPARRRAGVPKEREFAK